GFLQKDSSQEQSTGAEQPLDSPNLDGLPIQRGLHGENQADENGSHHASHTEDKCHERSERESERLPQAYYPALNALEFQVANGFNRATHPGGPGSCRRGAFRSTHVAELGSRNELRFAPIASLDHRNLSSLNRDRRRCDRRRPKVPLSVLNQVRHANFSPRMP